MFSSILSLKCAMRHIVGKVSEGNSMKPQQDKVLQMVHVNSPCCSQNRKQINEQAAFSGTSTSGCFKQRVVPFPKTISLIEKCSSVIG